MAGILDLDRNSFFGAMDELGIVGEQRDDLIRQYREKSSPVGLLMQAGETDPGMVRSDIMPFVRPEGMSLWDAWKSGDAEFAVPGFLTGAVSGSARAFDAPGAAGLGLIPEQDMAGEALGVAGAAQLGGGAVTRPMGSLGMGGRVAGGGLPEPRNAAEQMARDILDMRAAGRAGEVTDEMMAQADPQYMFYNTPLPMDYESRMARAGGRRDEFHGTTTGSDMTYADAFRGSGTRKGIGFVTSDNPYVASSYADPMFGSVFPMLNSQIPESAPRLDLAGNIWSEIPEDLTVSLGDRSILARQIAAGPADAGGVFDTNQISRGASFDYPSVEFQNIVDRSIHAPRPRTDDGMEVMQEFQRRSSQPSTVTMRHDTRGMRSRFARFDPDFAHLRDFNAANRDETAGLLAMAAADYQRRQPGSFSILGSDYFAPANPNAGRSKDPAMFSPYSATKHTVAPNEFEVYGTDLGGLMSPNVVSPSEIQKIYDRIYFATGDRTSANRAIEQINDLILRTPGVTYGGPEYMDLLRAWASEPTAMAAKANALQEVPEGVRSLLAYMPMGERSGDFSKHMSDVYGAATKVKMAGNAAPSNADVTKINDLISKKFPKLKDVPSVASDQFADWLSGQKGGTRAKIIKAFDGADFKALGMPDVSAVRFAVTNPDLVKSDALSVGYRMSEPDASGGIVRSKEHPSYGAYLPMAEGTQNMTLGYELPWWIGARDTALQKIAPGGKTYALPKDIKSYMGNPRIYQNIDQQWVDEASSYGDLLASEGKKAADDYARGLLSDYWSRN
jgi:hypothetical protein